MDEDCVESVTDAERIEELESTLRDILAWADAYPLSVFPEPNFEAAQAVLKANGMTLDAISASNMRHVLSGVKTIIARVM